MNQFARPGLGVTELPSFNENDKGKVLTINSESGALGWEEGSGGGSSGGGVLVVHIDDDTGALNKTWQEITNALKSGTLPVICYETPDGGGSIEQIAITSVESGAYNVFLMSDTSNPALSAESANGYPSWL